MAKFNTPGTRAAVRSPLATLDVTAPTFEGGVGYVRDAKSELFLTAVSTMAGEDNFYESGAERLERVRKLVAQVTAEDPKWMQEFLPWLRGPEGNLRTISIAAAVDYVKAGGPDARRVIDSVLQRADEPGEALAYLHSQYGRKLAGGLQRGIADAAVRLYNEYSAQKYDGVGANAYRLGDVIEMTHPKAKDAAQHTLFQYLLDRRHHSTDIRADISVLPQIAEARRLMAIPEDERRAALAADPDALKRAGWTWERLSGWLPGGMDAQAWETILGPEAKGIGYMALLRNLRNFSEAGISDAHVEAINARIKDPEEVAASRQFPFRFLSAYENSTIDYAASLEKALLLSTQNIPDLSGSLLLIDTSGSMQTQLSSKSSRRRVDVASVMALSTLARSKDCDVVIFGQGSAKVDLRPNDGILRGAATINGLIGSVGHSTFGWTAAQMHYLPGRHKRVVMFTDDQQFDSDPGTTVLPSVYTFDLGGYRVSSAQVGQNGRFAAGGFSDSTFKMLSLIERGRDGRWPWQVV